MIYSTMHGCMFGGRKSYVDYKLFPREKPVIAPPEPKTYTVDVPGADGELDYTTALTGYVNYKNRKGTFRYSCFAERALWDYLTHQILRDLHGKKLPIILDDDPSGFYFGRITVDPPEYNSDKSAMYLTFTADCDPWKYDLVPTTGDWIWDTFSFIDGVIREYNDITVTGSKTQKIYGSDRPVVPNVTIVSLTDCAKLSMTYPAGDTTKTVVWSSESILANTPDFVIQHNYNDRGVDVGYNVVFACLDASGNPAPSGKAVIDIEYHAGNL